MSSRGQLRVPPRRLPFSDGRPFLREAYAPAVRADIRGKNVADHARFWRPAGWREVCGVGADSTGARR